LSLHDALPICPNYRSVSVSVRTHCHALATPFPVVERPSEPFGELDGHRRAPLDCFNFFGYERIATDTPFGCDWSANAIISERHHFRNLPYPVSFPICSYSVTKCGSATFFCPSPARVRQSSARARHESDSNSNILSEPERSPTESMSQL